MAKTTSDYASLIDPHLANSLRVKVLSNSPPLRAIARRIVRAFPRFWTKVCGSYSGPCTLSLADVEFQYILGAKDTIGDSLYWLGEECWEADEVYVYRELVQKANGVVLDCGANFGVYSLIACAVNPNIRVIAWEPVPYIHQRFQINVNVNGFGHRISCRNAAISEKPGEATFFLHQDYTMSSLSNRTGEPIKVTVEAVDEVVPVDFSVSLVKIDIEGHESEALKGMRQVLHRDSPPIMFEALDAKAWQCVAEVLDPLGYTYAVIKDRSTSSCTQFVAGKTNYLAQRIMSDR